MTKRKASDTTTGSHSSLPPHKAARGNKSHGPSGGHPGAKPAQATITGMFRRINNGHHSETEKVEVRKSDIDDLDTNMPDSEQSNATGANHLQVIEKIGDLFAAPTNSVLIHACNCEGSWGAGIAKAFKDHYPQAYHIYRAHCLKSKSSDLPGTAFLIPPQTDSKDNDEASAGHFIGCLFTSRGKGRTKDSPTKILANTGPAMRDLLDQINDWNAKDDEKSKVENMLICKINSGLFNVPWEKTKAVLEKIEVAEDLSITVMEQG